MKTAKPAFCSLACTALPSPAWYIVPSWPLINRCKLSVVNAARVRGYERGVLSRMSDRVQAGDSELGARVR